MPECPYGAESCPKTEELRRELIGVNNKLTMLIIILACSWGEDIFNWATLLGWW